MEGIVALKIDKQSLEDRQIQLTVEVPEDRYQAALRRAARQLSKQTRIPGFRPGKAPYDVVVRQLGAELVFEEALDSLGQEVYRSALSDSEVEPYAPGTLDEVVSREPLVLRYTVPLAPEVDLGDYREIRISHDPPEVSDEALEAAMEELRQGQALIEPVERPAEKSDVVVIDAKGELIVNEEGEDTALLEESGISVLVDDETDWPVPGVVQYLVGLEAGQNVEFEYTFEDDYANESLSGRTAKFGLTCLEVKSRLVPEWSDALAQAVGEFDDLLDLRVKARESLQEQADHDAGHEYADRVMEAVVEQADVSYPPVLLEGEIDGMIEELDARLRRQNLSLEDYFKIEDKREDDLRAEFEPQARERLKRGLVLGQVVEELDFEIEEAEVLAELDRMSQAFGGGSSEELRKALDTDRTRRRIALDLLTQKAIDHLVSIAKGEAPDAAGDPAEIEAEAPAAETNEAPEPEEEGVAEEE